MWLFFASLFEHYAVLNESFYFIIWVYRYAIVQSNAFRITVTKVVLLMHSLVERYFKVTILTSIFK
jgi:hypothetical protein